jgi:hypothetical protein
MTTVVTKHIASSEGAQSCFDHVAAKAKALRQLTRKPHCLRNYGIWAGEIPLKKLKRIPFVPQHNEIVIVTRVNQPTLALILCLVPDKSHTRVVLLEADTEVDSEDFRLAFMTLLSGGAL